MSVPGITYNSLAVAISHGSEAQNVTSRKIRVGVIAPSYICLPLWASEFTGCATKRNLSFEFRTTGTTHGATEGLLNGDFEIALSAPEGTIVNAMNGGPLRIASGLINRPLLSLIAQKKFGSIASLKGAHLGTTSMKEGTRFLIQEMLSIHGLQYPQDYDFTLAGNHIERWAKIQEGSLDAAIQLIPFNYIAEEAGFPNLGDVDDFIPDFAFAVIASHRDWLAANREVAVDLFAALLEATDWIYENPTDAANHLAQKMNSNPRHAQRAVKDFSSGRNALPRDLKIKREAFDSVVRSMRLSEAFPSDAKKDAEAAIDYAVLNEAATQVH